MPVNVYTEWGPLREVILGTCVNFNLDGFDEIFEQIYYETLRQIETGSYTRHRFKADLHQRGRESAPERTPAQAPPPADLYDAYRDARLACGQPVKNLTPGKLDEMLSKQRGQLEARYGSDARFNFRVVVESGRAKLKASRKRG